MRAAVDELRRAKDKLERDLCCAITDCVREFQIRTGLAPSDISVDCIDVSTFGCVQPAFQVNSVRVILPI